jgi:hypothetical protein
MPKSDDDEARAERLREFYNSPFRPSYTRGAPSVPADLRAAQALEYIAAQLGMIREHVLATPRTTDAD